MPAAPVRNQFDRGRVVYLSEVRPAIDKPPAAPMTSDYWRLPSNWQELMDAVKWAAGGSLSLDVKGPLTVTVELTEHKMTEHKRHDERLLHLLNYDVARTPLVKDIEADVKIPEGKKLEQVVVLSPDEQNEQSLPYAAKDNRVIIRIPELKTYNLIVIKLVP